MSLEMTVDAVREARPGAKWQARWNRSWPAYDAWFVARGGDNGPSRAACEAALAAYMPELVPIHRRLTRLAGGDARAARFLSGWCPPAYLGGCTLAAHARGDAVRLVRNYDLHPDLNEGLLLRSDWLRPVMGMVEFLWGLSDGINDAGLAVALAYGGRREVARGFGVTHLLRYVLETCATVPEALAALRRIPSHMAYNLVLADAQGTVAAVALQPGGGLRLRPHPVAANHQEGFGPPEGAGPVRTIERQARAEDLLAGDPCPAELAPAFLSRPLFQTGYAEGFGTLFTAEYDPVRRGLVLHWPDQSWSHALTGFAEGRRSVRLGAGAATATGDGAAWVPAPAADPVAADWIAFGLAMARQYGAAACRGGVVCGR